MKTCPFCAEEVHDKAVKCKHCQSSLVKPKQGDNKLLKAILLICGLLLLFPLFVPFPIATTIVYLVLIWYFPRKNSKIDLKARLRDWKHEWPRVIVSGLVILIGLMFVLPNSVQEATIEFEDTTGFPIELRQEIFSKIEAANDSAREQADELYPTEMWLNLQVGETYQITEETPLMSEYDPVDPIAALSKIKQLPAFTSVTVLEIRYKNSQPWYRVSTSYGNGWINSIALLGQFTEEEKENTEANQEEFTRIIEEAEQEIKEEYELNEEEYSSIWLEGVTKNW